MRRAIWVLAALLWLAAPGFAYDEVFERSYPLPAGGAFTLSNVNGSVEVSGWERDEVRIHAVKSARISPQDLSRVRIEVEAGSEAVTVRTRYPHDDGVEVDVHYRVRVPARLRLARVETVNGAVELRGVEGPGELRSVNGSVEVLDCAGWLSARTTNGNVRVELRQILPEGESGEAPMLVESVNGSVVLSLPADADADLEVRSVNGDFRSELPVTVQGSAGGREWRGRLGRGGGTVRIRTVNGGIRVLTARPTV